LSTAVARTTDIPTEDLVLKKVKTSDLSNKEEMRKIFDYCLGTPGKLKFLTEKMREEANQLPTPYTVEEAL